jgi:hypothetical protein
MCNPWKDKGLIMAIEPVDPSKKSGGDGTEKYTPEEKRGPGKFDESLEKAKTDRAAEKEQIRKIGDALNKAGVPLGPRPESFPKTTAAFEEIARSDAERAARKAEKARAEVSKITEQVKSEPKYTGKAYSDTGPRTGPTSGGFGGGGGGGMPKINRDITKNMKKGGAVSSASKRADGCCIRGKTRA